MLRQTSSRKDREPPPARRRQHRPRRMVLPRTLPFPPSSSSSPPSPLHNATSSPLDEQRILTALTHSPTILFLHGNTGTRAHPLCTALYTSLTARLSANVLALDYRGFGDSEGHPTVSGVALDARAASEYLLSMGAREQDILVVGHSLGTAVAGCSGHSLGGKLDQAPDGPVLLVWGVALLKPLASLPFVPRVLTWSLAHNFDTLTLVPDIKCDVLVAHADDDWDIAKRAHRPGHGADVCVR
ncbi:putative alpha/beta hydrolase family protein [Lyophyllum shimeji]|uniref:Alpha/beta hydrolase family protein n=1 Tax=Lyophyllum shimeji TaxID=47721 RepID=A0A9P3Q1W0_LYOSH|nr:putative alpha/beta hydrolase family protein [Lyophyllum shimeji]